MYCVVAEKKLLSGIGTDERMSRNFSSRESAEEFMAILARINPTLVLRIKSVGK